MKICVLPGDGIGPEIMAEAIRVLKALDLEFEMEEALLGGAAVDATGEPYPQATQKLARAVKAAFAAEGVTIQQFNEAAGGQVVFNMHYHVMPRFEGVALRPHTGAMEKTEVLANNAEKIREALKKI